MKFKSVYRLTRRGLLHADSLWVPIKPGGLIVRPEPDNFPPFGSVLARLRPIDKTLPPFVHMPDILFNNGSNLPAQDAGFLGGACDPFVAGDPSVEDFRLPGLSLKKGMTHHRMQQRRELLAAINRQEVGGPAAPRLQKFQEQALGLLSSSAAHRAFDLSREAKKTRRRYGLPDREDRFVHSRRHRRNDLSHSGNPPRNQNPRPAQSPAFGCPGRADRGGPGVVALPWQRVATGESWIFDAGIRAA
jgi:hypothetical protein